MDMDGNNVQSIADDESKTVSIHDDTMASSSLSSTDLELSKILENKPDFAEPEQPQPNAFRKSEDPSPLLSDNRSTFDKDPHEFIAPPPQKFGNESNPNEPRRRSMRDIKRPKFDDEIVECIQTGHTKSTPKRRQSHEKSMGPAGSSSIEEDQSKQVGQPKKKLPEKNGIDHSQSGTSMAEDVMAILQSQNVPAKQIRRKRTTNPEVEGNGINRTNKMRKLHSSMNEFNREQIDSPKNSFKSTSNAASRAEAMKLWAPEDDIILIASVTHVADLSVVYSQTRFTKRYTLDQIEERWYELLYDEQSSQIAQKRMEQMSKERIQSIMSRIPFSYREEQLISEIPSNVGQNLHLHLERLLEQHRNAFHHARTIKGLEEHWRTLKASSLLVDQQRTPQLPEEENYIEQTYDLYSLVGMDLISSEHLPLDVEERYFTRNTLISEREAKEWESVLVSSVTGILSSTPTMGPETIGMLCGRSTTFDIRKEKVLIGRSTKKHNVDVNLTMEGPTARISRKQAILKLAEGGDYLLRNIGKRPISVDGRIIVEGEAAKLSNEAMIEINPIKLKFLKNENYKPKKTEDRPKWPQTH